MAPAPIVLVPGFWLGAWAWDEVASALRADGHEVTALTLPGLESPDADRSSITLSDHVDAIVEAVSAAGRPVVLAVHSGSGAAGYAVSDRVPEQIAAMVYVDSGPATGALDPDFADAEKPLPSAEELASEENLDGLSDEQLATFRERAVPQPGGVLREAPGSRTTRDSTFPARPSRRDSRPISTRTRSRRATRGSAASPTCGISPGSTCRRATGRCGRVRRSSRT